ncbi:MAG: response regulator [Bacteriovoracaceae bacterium]|nr:response regulator [Bacteriovoracaceae bacterium]
MSRKSVLMIDDNADLVEVAKVLFDAKEFMFVAAKDGTEGLFKAKNQKFDVIICDIKMPRMDGITFAQEFRRTIKHETPILFYSGHLEEMPLSLKNLKGLYRLAKPSQGYELVQKVRSLASGVTEAAAPTPANINQRRFSAGSFIFHEAENGAEAFMVDEGEVELVKENPDGSVIVLDTLHAGEFLGTWAPTDGQFRFHGARAKTVVKLTEIPQALIKKEMEGKPAWFEALVRGKHQRLQASFQRLKKELKAS